MGAKEQYEIVCQALWHLAEVCDGAHDDDDLGFNARDTQFGHSLAEQAQSRVLSEKQQMAAVKMLQLYRGQLSSAGISLPSLSEYQAYRNGDAPQESPTKPQVAVQLCNDGIAITFPYNSKLVEQVKSLPERRWHKPSKRWIVPTRLAAEVLAMFPNADVALEVVTLANRNQQLAEMSTQATADFNVPNLIGGTLLPFQKAGVQFLEMANGRGIVADQMGLGKTIQAIAYLALHPELRPAVIVVPASLKINWGREIAKWLGVGNRVIVLSGTKAHDLALLGSTDIYIINYDILTYWVEHLKEVHPQVLILDEAHYIKHGKKTLRGEAAQLLAAEVPHIILLTGTPITSRPIELYPLLNITAPAAWSNFWQYAHRYCAARNNGWGWDFTGASNLDELYEKTRAYIVRRTKEQVLQELPAKRRVPLAMSTQDLGEYEKALGEAREQIIYARTAGLPIAANHLALIERMKQAAVSAKLPAAMDWIKDFINSGEKLVVFVTHHFVVDALMSVFGNKAVRLTGEDRQKARQDAIDRFQNDDEVRLFVGNIQAAGVGITLTAASDVAFLEFGWTPGEHDQAEDRCHRIGQHDSVTCWYLAAEDTIDEKIINLLERKRCVVDEVTDGEPGALRFSILNELADVIAPIGEE
jgi:SWI/SNF-related matrix-associated actin-dependent regulator 1 of chromatin subfamily A